MHWTASGYNFKLWAIPDVLMLTSLNWLPEYMLT